MFGSLLSGYVYKYNNSLPWMLLSGSLILFGIVFLVVVREADKPEI